MDNAAKALIMAGGILIAMITISIFYYIFNVVSDYQDNTSIDYDARELEAFNKKFEAYNKKIMYGADLISVYNLVNEANEKYDNYMGFTGVDMRIDNPPRDGLTGEEIDIEDVIKEVKEKPIENTLDDENKRSENTRKFTMSLFRCTGIEYNEERLGMLNYIQHI